MENILETLIAEVPELEPLLANFGFIPALAMVIVGIVLAFCGIRLFKICLALSGTYLFGTIGYTVVATVFEQNLPEIVAEIPVNIAALAGFVLAAIGFALSWKLYKFAIFLFGGAIGYTVGTSVAMMLAENLEGEFFTSEMFPLIVSVVCAIIVGIITLFIFKFLYIFVTSFSGMFIAMFSAYLVVAPKTGTIGLGLFAILAIVLSIVAMVYQFRHSEGV